MSTTSQKHHNFVSEPMGDKPVTDLAGIGEVLGKRLSDQGFDRVSCSKCMSSFEQFFAGFRCPWSILSTEERPRIVCGVDERECES